MTRHLLSLAPILLAACQSAPHDTPRADASTPADVEQLVRQYVAATGDNVTYDEATGRLLASLTVTEVGPGELRVLKVASAPTAEPAFEVVPLRFAAAPELAATLSELAAAAAEGGAKPAVKILSDDRTNSLLVMAPPEHMARLKDLIALLDRDATAEG